MILVVVMMMMIKGDRGGGYKVDCNHKMISFVVNLMVVAV